MTLDLVDTHKQTGFELVKALKVHKKFQQSEKDIYENGKTMLHIIWQRSLTEDAKGLIDGFVSS